jgi:hypothetical protein
MQTPNTAGPTLTRTSLQGSLTRSSLAGGGNSGTNSPSASRPALARVSAHDFPNLSRASQLSQESAAKRAAAGLKRSSMVKAQQEMSKRAEGPMDVGVTVTIVDDITGEGVTYKNDGTRFAVSKFTLKMVQVWHRHASPQHPQPSQGRKRTTSAAALSSHGASTTDCCLQQQEECSLARLCVSRQKEALPCVAVRLCAARRSPPLQACALHADHLLFMNTRSALRTEH